MTKMIETRALTKIYGKNHAVSNLSITIYKKDIYGLIGKNGAGKTTLFKMLMGLSKPSNGEMIIEGSSNNNELMLARNNIGFMIGANFFNYLSARDNIEYYRKLKGIKDKDETNRVLKIVELDKVRKPFKTFSLGMKQRLGIANALLGNPDIVILDEPINGLDPEGIKDVRKIISKTNDKYGTTFIISSHILSELDLVCNRFGFIDKGNLIKEIDYENLHKSTEKVLKIEVDNVDKAIVLLENELGINDYRIDKSNLILINQDVDDTYKIPQLLVKNNIKLYSISKQETTLEEYFLNLIGGKNNG